MTMVPFDPTKPAYQAPRASSDVRNNLNALFDGDGSPLRPRAQSTPNMTIYISGTDCKSYWRQVWVGTQVPLNFAGGNSPTLTAPTSNPRIDLLTIDSNGTLAWVTGAEASNPSPPNCPEGRIPICWVWCRPTMTKIVNYEDAGSYPNDGYIFRDVRPFLNLGGGTGILATNFQSFSNVLFGNGSDGNVTISSNTTLPAGTGGIQVRQYNNLTVNSGVYLEGNSADKVLVILVKETLTINGTIRMNGRGGAGGAANNPGGAGAIGGGGGGGTSGYVGSGGGGNGSAGSGTTGGGQLSIYGGRWDQGGPVRGTGGDGGGGGGSLNGACCLPAMRTPWPFELARTFWGAGGGGGHQGGAGGTGGGVLWIEANNIVWGGSGIISVNGVAGSAGGGWGGGGGGAGGFVQVVFRTKSGTANIQASGGGGGSGTWPGGSGAAGITGEFQLA